MDPRPDSLQAVPAHQGPGHLAPAETASAYLTAFWAGHFDAARALLAADFSFSGPFVQVRGRDPFLASAAGLRPVIRGHRLLRQWADGDEVCSWYDVDLETPVTSGSVTMSEWHTAVGGKLTSGRVVFDAVAFRAFLPSQ